MSADANQSRLGTRRILRFWWPLASTWLLMAVEGVALAAILARLPMPIENLAAYGVAFAFAILVESPVILLMSASTALVRDAQGYRALARFTARLNLGVTAMMVVLVLPPVWGTIGRALGLQPEVATLVHGALLCLLPWPAAIGDRRFHQGLLIRGHRTGKVAVGTVARIAAMLATAVGLAAFTALPGATVAGAALSAGVVTEMLIVRWMVRPVLEPLREAARALDAQVPHDLTQRAIFRFYLPLALTSVITLASQPVITFFMGQAPRALESLAVLPVIHGLTFLFRALALSYQEVGIALMGDRGENYRMLRNVAYGLTAGVALVLGSIAFTPLSGVWLGRVAGLEPELVAFAVLPLQLYALLPSLSVLQSWQRALLVHGRRTGPLGPATAIEIGLLALTLAVLVLGFEVIGAVAAAWATLAGRVAGLLVLVGPAQAVRARYD